MISGFSGIDTGIQTSQKKPADGHKAATEGEIKQSLTNGTAHETATLLNQTAGDRSPIRFIATDVHLLQVVAKADPATSLMNVYTGSEKQVLGADPENATGNPERCPYYDCKYRH